MRMRIQFKDVIITVLLLAAALLNGISIYLILKLDSIVHGELYQFGLTFDPQWATQYWTFHRLAMVSLAVSMLIEAVSVAWIVTHTRPSSSPRALAMPLTIAGITVAFGSILSLVRLDSIVHGELYQFGLTFDPQWAVNYWNYSYTAFSLIGFAVAAAAISTVLTGMSRNSPVRVNGARLASYSLMSAGIVLLALSFILTSSIMTLIGLGLTFWGGVLLYVQPERHVKERVLVKTVSPSLASMEQVLQVLGFKGKGIHLPPRYLKDPESSKLYISVRENPGLPDLELMQNADNTVFLDSTTALLTPPGSELAGLFEKTLKTSFTKVETQHLEEHLARLIVEELEIAQGFEMKTENDTVHVTVMDSIYKELWKEIGETTSVRASLGCPLISSVACALAKVTGKPVIIEKIDVKDQAKKISVKYRLLE